MTNLADRVLAAIEETEKAAKACAPGPWRWGDWSTTFGTRERQRRTLEHAPDREPFPAVVDRDQESRRVLPGLEYSLEHHDYDDEPVQVNADHIVRHDPAAVLRRCAADREIVELHKRVDETYLWLCQTCGEFGQEMDCTYPCDTLRLIARGYGITEEES